MNTSHAFDRHEAFQIYLGLINASAGKNIDSLLQPAIELAKNFEAHMDALPDILSVPQILPLDVFCRFFHKDNSVLIETSGGERFLVAEYPNSVMASRTATTLNSWFEEEVNHGF
ncbi:hypothetical protein Lepto7376_3742 [[Leptolyngbya] sp. PCC 7376]|uniref:hypothetical protein n=1 Tax=[Leptolyngbya] sp. PCC 7376 TaxID=111781 RepID=UPI00029EEEB6|nr:hypothetical protein [[Leptolyngbya] sp. PCC 7376]AFY39916.1 hypothetical protein Lepto7376_3742 [[Leptolyngbya] sp. PCC 7376]